MKTLTWVIITVIFVSDLQAQNRVQNPSLEIFISCPTGSSQLWRAPNWATSKNSPDYLNVCSASPYSDTPLSFYGDQVPATGNAYGGGLQYGGFSPTLSANLREYLYVTLTSPLTVGTTYYISLKISLADNSQYAVNNLGIQFCSTYNNNFPINNMADVYTTSVISDKIGWTTLAGSFVPSIAYNALVIGNFFTDANTTATFVGTAIDIGYCAYYFFDDMIVSPTPIPLPVSWELANLKLNERVARLSWKINLNDVSVFQIERSINGSEYHSVKQISAAENLPVWSADDTLTGYGPMVLYRIRAILNDGSTHLSPVLAAEVYEADVNFLRVFPSPVNAGQNFTVEYHSGKTGAPHSLQILNLEGKEIASESLEENNSGFHHKVISTSDFRPGVYWVKAGNLTRMMMVD